MEYTGSSTPERQRADSAPVATDRTLHHFTFKPASHRTSFDSSSNYQMMKKETPYRSSNLSPYKNLPQDVFEATVPLRKEFSSPYDDDDDYQKNWSYWPKTKIRSTNVNRALFKAKHEHSTTTSTNSDNQNTIVNKWLERVERGQVMLEESKTRCTQIQERNKKLTDSPFGFQNPSPITNDKLVPLFKNSNEDLVVLISPASNKTKALLSLIEKATQMHNNVLKETKEDIYIDNNTMNSESLLETSNDTFYTCASNITVHCK